MAQPNANEMKWKRALVFIMNTKLGPMNISVKLLKACLFAYSGINVHSNIKFVYPNNGHNNTTQNDDQDAV